MAIVAIDAGTSTIKAVAFDRDGRELYVARRGSSVQRPHEGWSEQDMAYVWELACEATRETVLAVGAVESIAITAQGDGLWLIDPVGEPVRPAMLWNDGRAASYVNEWLGDGTVARAYMLNGSIPFSGLASALLRWLADNEPESLARSAYALTCGSWIFHKLTGEVRAELSDAFVPFVDAATERYSDTLISLFGVERCKGLLPTIGIGAGRLSHEAAASIGLSAGLPIVLAPYDVPSAALGVGACEPHDAIAVLGTTFLCGIVGDAPRIEGEPAGCLIPLGLPSRYLRFHATLAGMEVVHWAARTLGLEDARDVIALAANASPGANGLVFLPYLSPAGERAPFLDSSARGGVLESVPRSRPRRHRASRYRGIVHGGARLLRSDGR